MKQSIKESISKNIARYRKESGFSQKELAEKIGAKNLTTVSSWERGISSPDADTTIQLCELFGITLYDLYNVKNTESDLSYEEKKHIEKYRCLDDYGKRTVDMILDSEYVRTIEMENSSELDIDKEVAQYRKELELEKGVTEKSSALHTEKEA